MVGIVVLVLLLPAPIATCPPIGAREGRLPCGFKRVVSYSFTPPEFSLPARVCGIGINLSPLGFRMPSAGFNSGLLEF